MVFTAPVGAAQCLTIINSVKAIIIIAGSYTSPFFLKKKSRKKKKKKEDRIKKNPRSIPGVGGVAWASMRAKDVNCNFGTSSGSSTASMMAYLRHASMSMPFLS